MTEHFDKDTRQDQILDAAAQLFTAKGFENSSVDEIAKEAGLSKGAIYWHFKSKLEILLALSDRFVRDQQETLVRMVDMGNQGPEALYKSHRFIWERKLVDPNGDLLLNQLVSLMPQFPEIKDHLARYHREWDELAERLLDQAVARGHFKPCNTKLVAQAINAMYHGVCVHAQMLPDINPVDVIEYATKLFYDALIINPPIPATGNIA